MLFLNRKHYLNLGIGIIKENYAIVANDDVSEWKTRGFKVIKKYPVFHYIPNKNEKIMLGIPMTISQFGVNQLLKSTIVGVSTCGGTYGMGGPGFFELSIKTMSQDNLKLTFCFWDAGSSILLDDRIIESHPDYYNEYHPYIRFSETNSDLWMETTKKFEELLNGCTIESIFLSQEECQIKFSNQNNELHSLWTARYSERFPPKRGIGKRKNAFDTTSIESVLLVTYSGSHLVV